MADPKKTPAAGEARTPQPTGQPTVQPIDDSRVESAYANFFRVTNTAEEMIIDFGLNPATAETQHIPVILSQRIVLNHFTAKRLLQALAITIDRHEKAFGQVETSVQRRLVPQQPPKT